MSRSGYDAEGSILGRRILGSRGWSRSYRLLLFDDYLMEYAQVGSIPILSPGMSCGTTTRGPRGSTRSSGGRFAEGHSGRLLRGQFDFMRGRDLPQFGEVLELG